LKSCSEFDPREDTETQRLWRLHADTSTCCSEFDPREDTETASAAAQH